MGGQGSGRRTVITPAETPRQVPATREGEPNALADVVGVMDAEHAEAEVKRAAAELGDNITGAKVQVWRIIPGSRYPAYVTTYAPDAFSLEKVADDCGGGTYDIKLYAPSIDDQGRQKGLLIVARPRIFLDGPAKVIHRPDPAPDQAKAAPSTVPSEITLLAKAMQDGFTQMGVVLLKATERPSLIETLKELVAVKSLFSNDTPRGADPLEQFEKFLNMRDKMQSAVDRLPAEASDNQLLIALGRDFLSMFKKGVDAGAPAALPNPGPVADPSPLLDAPQPVVPAPAQVSEDDPMNLIFKGYVNLLVSNAKGNNDIEPIAQTIYDQAPDDLLAKLFATDAWLDELAKLNPSVKLYPQWFEKLRARIKEIHDADSAGD